MEDGQSWGGDQGAEEWEGWEGNISMAAVPPIILSPALVLLDLLELKKAKLLVQV